MATVCQDGGELGLGSQVGPGGGAGPDLSLGSHTGESALWRLLPT